MATPTTCCMELLLFTATAPFSHLDDNATLKGEKNKTPSICVSRCLIVMLEMALLCSESPSLLGKLNVSVGTCSVYGATLLGLQEKPHRVRESTAIATVAAMIPIATQPCAYWTDPLVFGYSCSLMALLRTASASTQCKRKTVFG